VGVKKITKPYLKKVANSVHAALINSDYAGPRFQSVNVNEDFCNFYTNANITNTLPPVVKIIGGTDFYYLTNYLGQSTENSSTDTSKWWNPLSFNALPIQKYFLPVKSMNKAMKDAWGYYPNATVSSRRLTNATTGAAIPNGTVLFSDSIINAFPKNVVLYCNETNGFYRVTDYSNNSELLTRDNIVNYVPSWKDSTVANSGITAYKALPDADKALCEFNAAGVRLDAAGVRLGNCTLPKEIIYVQNCTASGLKYSAASKRQGAVQQIDGQYYTCENDATIPKRVFQYVAGSLREVNSEPNQAWADLLATIPSISNCGAYITTGVKRSHEKRAVLAIMAGAIPKVNIVSTRIVCTTVCSLNSLAILTSGSCHNEEHFGNSLNSDQTGFKPACLRELIMSCVPPDSPLKQNICGKDGLDNCNEQKRDKLYKTCQRIYDNFADRDITVKDVLTKCSPWNIPKGKASAELCNSASAHYFKNFRYGRILDQDIAGEMQTFLISEEGSPFKQ